MDVIENPKIELFELKHVLLDHKIGFFLHIRLFLHSSLSRSSVEDVHLFGRQVPIFLIRKSCYKINLKCLNQKQY